MSRLVVTEAGEDPQALGGQSDETVRPTDWAKVWGPPARQDYRWSIPHPLERCFSHLKHLDHKIISYQDTSDAETGPQLPSNRPLGPELLGRGPLTEDGIIESDSFTHVPSPCLSMPIGYRQVPPVSLEWCLGSTPTL